VRKESVLSWSGLHLDPKLLRQNTPQNIRYEPERKRTLFPNRKEASALMWAADDPCLFPDLGKHVVNAYFGYLFLMVWNRQIEAIQLRDENSRLGSKRTRIVTDLDIVIGVALLKHIDK
jgi:hypothetical protein